MALCNGDNCKEYYLENQKWALGRDGFLITISIKYCIKCGDVKEIHSSFARGGVFESTKWNS